MSNAVGLGYGAVTALNLAATLNDSDLKQVLTELKPMEHKLFCLCDARGEARLQHPLSPAVRTWELSPLKISELLPEAEVKPEPPKKGKKPAKKEEPAA